jgi:16S rRNA A1518/A1519 N6-dimethyltransferase RsmA/KsgA/DIM1 with predicted DNA glycosylase/AP lyase activity
MDLRYGGSLAGTVPALTRETSAVTNSQYSVLPHIFAGRIGADDVLVDIGCGKGRVINWWLSQGLRNRMIGIEHHPEVAAATARRLRRFPNVTIVNEDATAWLPDDATVAYMYNPFGYELTARFKERLAERYAGHRFTLLYWNPEFVEAFLGDPRFDTEVLSLPPGLDPRLEGTHRRFAVVRLAPA